MSPQCWTAVIQDAEAAILLSARDGKLLKPVSPEHRLGADALLQTLHQQIDSAPWRLQLARRLLLAGAWARRKGAQRAAAAIMRGHVYCQRGALDVAMRVRGACSRASPATVGRRRPFVWWEWWEWGMATWDIAVCAPDMCVLQYREVE